jgi:hypothetical protein
VLGLRLTHVFRWGFGFVGAALRPFWETNIVIAAEGASPKGNVQTDEDNSAAKSAKMGKDEGTQTRGANQGTPAEADTQKIEQPPHQNPTTGE